MKKQSYLKKFLYFLLTIYLSLSAIFLAVRLAPGDPVMKILGPNATASEINKYRHQLGLDMPIHQQYSNFFIGLLKGDLGKSLFTGKEVTYLLKDHMPPTITLAIMATLLSSLLGITVGIVAGNFKSGPFDNSIRILSLLALSFPIFSLAPILVYFFAIKLNLLPVSEWNSGLHAVLPIITLTIPLTAIVIRVARNKFLEESSAPWITTLRAKGMGDIGILLRLTKISLPTIFNVIAIQLSVVLAGTMITETIFDIPGIGTLLFEGIQNRDYPTIQGIIAYSTLIYMGIYFLIDLINSKIDTRIQS